MQSGRRVVARRWVVLATAVALVGAMAPAATAKAAAKPKAPKAKATKVKPAKKVAPKRTGLIVSVCKFSHRSNDDPIVFPGQTGASHTHDFFGNRSVDADSTVASLAGQATTCGVDGDTAAYWAPTLNVNGTAMRPGTMFAYYSVFGNDPVHTLPIGLRMIAKGRDVVRFSCFNHSMPTAALMKIPTCKPGEQMSMGVNFPSCWNGVDLDSADHRSHMAYPSYGVCPAGYPVKVPRLAIWVMYKAVPRGSLVTLSSGLLDTAHADYVNTWDPTALKKLEQFCLNGHRECYKLMPRVLRTLKLKHNKLAEIVTNSPTAD